MLYLNTVGDISYKDFSISLFDGPWWYYAGLLIPSLLFLVWLMYLLRRSFKKGEGYKPSKGVQVLRIFHTALIIFGVWFSVGLVLKALEKFRSNVTYGTPTAFSRMISRFDGSEIIFCVPNVENHTTIDLKWYLGGVLINEPTVTFSALGTYKVGISDFGTWLKAGWSEGPTDGPKVDGKSPYVIHVRLPKPSIDETAGTLFTTENQMTDDEAKKHFGDAWVQCGGRSGFRSSSGGGLLIRVGEAVVGPGTGRFNEAQSQALKKARELVEKPDPALGGKTLLEKAQAEAEQSVIDLILSANPDALAKLQEQYDVQVEIDSVDPGV